MNWRIVWPSCVALSASLLGGCVERRYVVTSDPPGAIVLRNYEQIGATPADDHFVYYGDYHFTLIKDGYQTLQVDQEIRAPWYEYIPLDFVSENLVPWRIIDVRRFHYRLEPLQQISPDELLNRGQALRNRGHSLATPAAPPGPVPAPPQAPPIVGGTP
jgi:PEGA domain